MKGLKWVFWFLVAFWLALWYAIAHAQTTMLVMGKEQYVRAPMCLTKEDMITVAQADVEGGPPAAIKVFNENPNCDVGDGVVLPVSVVFSGPTKRGATVRVIEIRVDQGDGTKATYYMMVDVQLSGLVNT